MNTPVLMRPLASEWGGDPAPPPPSPERARRCGAAIDKSAGEGIDGHRPPSVPQSRWRERRQRVPTPTRRATYAPVQHPLWLKRRVAVVRSSRGSHGHFIWGGTRDGGWWGNQATGPASSSFALLSSDPVLSAFGTTLARYNEQLNSRLDFHAWRAAKLRPANG